MPYTLWLEYRTSEKERYGLNLSVRELDEIMALLDLIELRRAGMLDALREHTVVKLVLRSPDVSQQRGYKTKIIAILLDKDGYAPDNEERIRWYDDEGPLPTIAEEAIWSAYNNRTIVAVEYFYRYRGTT